MVMEGTRISLSAQSVGGCVHKQAEESLEQFREQNVPGFLISLSGELVNEEQPVDSSKLVALILKNAYDAKEKHRKNELGTQMIEF